MTAAPDRPNILYVLSDQHRRESTGCYGHTQVRTPHLDRMATEGVKFEHCWSASPVCSPYRCSVQTGLYPHQHGMVQNNLYLDQRIPTFADWMRQVNYQTTYIGKSHWWGPGKPGFVDAEGQCRWENWIGHNRGHFHYDAPIFDDNGELTHEYQGQYDAEAYTDIAIQCIDAFSKDRPWCMQLNLGQPHTQTMTHLYEQPDVRERMKKMNEQEGFGIADEYFDRIGEDWFPQALVGPHVPQEYLDMYPLDEIDLPPNVDPEMGKLARLMLREYYAMITSVDDQVGRLLDHLRNTGLSKNTVVIYTSDHGDFVGSLGRGRSKAQPYQCAARVPLIVWGHENLAQGRVVEAPVSSVDMLPSMVEFSGQVIEGEAGPWTYEHQTTHERNKAITNEPMSPGRNFLRGKSYAALTQSDYEGELETQENIIFQLGGWRAIFDGQWFYAVDLIEGQVKPRHLINTAQDAWDLENQLENETERAAKLQQSLSERLLAEADGHWAQCVS